MINRELPVAIVESQRLLRRASERLGGAYWAAAHAAGCQPDPQVVQDGLRLTQLEGRRLSLLLAAQLMP